MIKLRSKVLESILQVSPSAPLNISTSQNGGAQAVGDLAGEIKSVLNTVQGKAIRADGRQVDYHQIRILPEYKTLRKLTDQLVQFDFVQLESKEEKLAFWINLYNALVIDAVIQEDIQESVIESRLGILAFFQKAAYWINGQRFSLEDIEHGVLRANQGFPYFPGKQFAVDDPRIEAVIHPLDARIHFALNCASISCPPIAFYTPDKIHQQLDQATRSFINQDLEIDPDSKKIKISRIFSWYKKDFGGNQGILDFLSEYLEDQEQCSWIKDNQNLIRIQHHEYDWGLNKLT